METYLAHHGILGMKWGIRRFQDKDGTLTASGKIRYGRKMTAKRKAAAKKSAQTKKRNAEAKTKEEASSGKPRDISTMSDQEIRDFLNRRDLEKRYLAEVTPKQLEKGQSTAQKYLSEFGNTLASSIVKGLATRIAKNVLDSIFDTGDKNSNSNSSNKDDNKQEKSKKQEKKSEQPEKNKKRFFESKSKATRSNPFENQRKKQKSNKSTTATEKVFEGVVEDGWNYVKKNTEKYAEKPVIDVDTVPYERAQDFIKSLPSYNSSVLLLPEPK